MVGLFLLGLSEMWEGWENHLCLGFNVIKRSCVS